MPKFQATEVTTEFVGRNYLTNYQCKTDARKKACSGQILYVIRAYFARI